MRNKIFPGVFIFFTILLFGGGRATATLDTLWRSLKYSDIVQTQFSPDDSLLAIFTKGTYNFRVKLIDPKTGIQLRAYEPIYYPKFSPDGRYLIGYLDSDIVVVRVDSMIKFREYDKGLREIAFIDISSDGRKIYANYLNTTYSVWDFNTGQRIEDVVYDSCQGCRYKDAYAMAVSDSLNTIILKYQFQFGVNEHDPSYRFEPYFIAYDFVNKTKRYDIPIGNPYLKNFIMSYDRRRMYERIDSFIVKRDIATGNILDTFRTPIPNEYVISKDEKYLIISLNESMEVWNLENKTKIYTYPLGPYYSVSLSNNNKYLCGESGFLDMYSTPWFSSNVKEEGGINALLTYPNPCDSKINLDFNLTKPGITKIQITDLVGNTIKQIEDKYLNEGNHSIPLNTESLLPGVYFIRLESGASKSINKIIINK